MDTVAMVTQVREALQARACPANAEAMARYMKTSDPFFGVKRPGRREVDRLARGFQPTSADEYRDGVLALWQVGKPPERELRYAAIQWARHHKAWITSEQLDLYATLIRDGAWWDTVDDIAANLVGTVWRKEREAVGPIMDSWINDEDLWIRRAAILGQLKHGVETDAGRLFRYSRQCAHESDFFIRKAIGWALRQYARTDPEAVRAFVDTHRAMLSGLSVREATRHL